MNPKYHRLLQILSPRLLLKSGDSIVVFAFIALLMGFIVPSVNLYELLNRVMRSGSISPLLTIFVIAGILLVNLLVIPLGLKTKYAIEEQATAAGILMFLLLVVLAFIGFWGRVILDFQFPASEEIATGASSQVSQLSPAPLAVVIVVASTLSLFNLVYSFAFGPYSKVDYAAFQSSMKSFYEQLTSLERSTANPIFRKSHTAELRRNLRIAKDSLEGAVAIEPQAYTDFVKSKLISPINKLDSFLATNDVQAHPEITRELLRDKPDDVSYTWILKENYYSCYRELTFILGKN